MPDKIKTAKKILVKKPVYTSDLDIELTNQYNNSIAKMADNLEDTKEDIKEDKMQGIDVKKEGMEASPKVFVRKVITNGDKNGTTKILSEDGKKVIYEGRSNMKATEQALLKNAKEVDDTNERRENNANFYNVNSGAKKDLTIQDKKTLVKLGKAVIK